MHIVPFDFEGASVRVLDRKGEPWFVLADVCRVLDVANPRDAATRLDDDEKDGVGLTDAIGRTQETTIINESGLYSVILTSRKPSAKRFKKWVTAEVLPSIRKTGSYGNVDPIAVLNDPAAMRGLLLTYTERVIALEGRLEAAKPKTDFYDSFVSADGLYGLQNAARVLGQPPQKFIGALKQEYLFYQGGALVPKVEYRKRGLFEVKATEVDGKARYQTYVTPKGIQFFAQKLQQNAAMRL